MPRFNIYPLRLQRRIQWLVVCRWIALLGLPCAAALVSTHKLPAFVSALTLSAMLAIALQAWEKSLRRQFVREARLPPYLGAKLRAKYPQLTAGDTDLVLRGLRQFFMAYLRSGGAFVAMPSQVADDAWHEFILHTKAYAQWCHTAFGHMLHHTPAQVLGKDTRRNSGLRRAWVWACKEESIDPAKPTRLPLLFALDKKFAIPGGFHYVPDCNNIDRQNNPDAYCASSFSSNANSSSGCGGSDGLSFSFDSSSDASGCAGDGGCSGGCGGGD